MFSIFQLQTPPFMVVQYLIDACAVCFFADRHIPTLKSSSMILSINNQPTDKAALTDRSK